VQRVHVKHPELQRSNVAMGGLSLCVRASCECSACHTIQPMAPHIASSPCHENLLASAELLACVAVACAASRPRLTNAEAAVASRLRQHACSRYNRKVMPASASATAATRMREHQAVCVRRQGGREEERRARAAEADEERARRAPAGASAASGYPCRRGAAQIGVGRRASGAMPRLMACATRWLVGVAAWVQDVFAWGRGSGQCGAPAVGRAHRYHTFVIPCLGTRGHCNGKRYAIWANLHSPGSLFSFGCRCCC